MLLSIIARPVARDNFEVQNYCKSMRVITLLVQVTTQSIAYLAALVSLSEEMRSKCHVKHSVPELTSSTDTPTVEDFVLWTTT